MITPQKDIHLNTKHKISVSNLSSKVHPAGMVLPLSSAACNVKQETENALCVLK